MSGVISSFGREQDAGNGGERGRDAPGVMRIERTGMPTSAAARGFWLVARSALPVTVRLKTPRAPA